MGVTLTRTVPGADMHTGALLRGCLDRAGVRYRIEGAYLVALPESGPAVRITAHNVNGGSHYDIPRGCHMGFTAVALTEGGPVPVYDGTGPGGMSSAGCAHACADAVAVQFGLPLAAVDEWWKS